MVHRETRVRQLPGVVASCLALASLFLQCSAGMECSAGVPCIFMGKADGWEEYRESTGPKPFPIKSDSWAHSDTTIFYSISSYRDELCPRTLFNAFTKAAYPQRIHIAVVQQNTVGDIDCLERYCEMMAERNSTHSGCPFENQIQMNRQRAEDAKGPTWARAIGSTMVGDEEFCMQTDSHMDFVHNWDRNLLSAWALTENEYAVLSTYVTSIEELSKVEDGQRGINSQHEVPHLCMITYGANQMVRNWGTKCLRNFPKPKMTNMLWGAGLSFSKCHAEKKTLYDPYTPGIFDGEEFTKAIKLWTYGYDIYTPHRVYVVHDYHKSQSNPIHSGWARVVIPEDERDRGILRMKTVCGLPEGMSDPAEALKMRRSKYGLGDRRSIEQAMLFSGILLTNRTSLGNRCGNLDFVPFVEHPLGPDYIPQFDLLTLDPLDKPDIGSIYYDRLSSRSKKVQNFVEKSIADQIDKNGLMRVQQFSSRAKAVQSANLRQQELGMQNSYRVESVLHTLAFLSIFLGPVTLVMICLGRCSSIYNVFSCCNRDGKLSGKHT